MTKKSTNVNDENEIENNKSLNKKKSNKNDISLNSDEMSDSLKTTYESTPMRKQLTNQTSLLYDSAYQTQLFDCSSSFNSPSLNYLHAFIALQPLNQSSPYIQPTSYIPYYPASTTTTTTSFQHQQQQGHKKPTVFKPYE